MSYSAVPDPLRFVALHWPDIYLYSQMREAFYSHVEDDITVIGAGNMLGKDFLASLIVLYFVLTRSPVRIVMTSATGDHLRVLWGEIGQRIATSKYPLDSKRGGPLICNHQDIRKIIQSGPRAGERCPLSYVTSMVASNDTIAAMQGHHIAKTGDGIPRTLFISDECSSVWDEIQKKASTWANRQLWIGNTWPCSNFFYRAFEGDLERGDPGGNLPRDNGVGYHRRVFRIQATDSPNVRLAMAEAAAGKKPSGDIIIPGVKDWEEYQKDLKMYTDAELDVIHRAQFYKGKDVKMYPEEWILNSLRMGRELRGAQRQIQAIGVDPGEGAANTVWTGSDRKGIVQQVSMKTPDTSVIPDETERLLSEWGVPPDMVFFDRGGGGKQCADELRKRGLMVHVVPFGAPVDSGVHPGGIKSTQQRELEREQKYSYYNRRAQMYMMLHEAMDPAVGGYAIPPECHELVRQLRPIPMLKDGEGKIRMLPKGKPHEGYKGQTLIGLLGRSPDEADSAVLSVYGMHQEPVNVTVGAIS